MDGGFAHLCIYYAAGERNCKENSSLHILMGNERNTGFNLY